MILRDFLFLDTNTLTSYLSTVDGYAIEGPIEETESDKKDVGGGLDIKALSAKGSHGSSKETKRKLAVTDEAKFQRLYEYLEETEALQLLDAFDMEIWNQLVRGEVVEIQANIRFPRSLLITHDVENIAPLIDLMEVLGQNLLADEQTQQAFIGMRAVGKSIENRPIPLICEPISTRGFSFIAHLSKEYIRRDLADFQGEAVVFGKIQRILKKGERLEVFSLVPAITGATSLNRQQRRKMEKSAQKNNITEEIKGPAIVLTPVAVYR
jgi:hypothetical protein